MQAIEIAQGRRVEPFNGYPASALILPPKTIVRSKTFTGDPIILEAEAGSPTNRTTDPASQSETETSLEDLGSPSEMGRDPRPDRQQRRRRAPRTRVPRLIGYCVAGGPSTPYEVRDISVLGFYMITNQRWKPGTVIRVTLKALQSDGGFHDSITVISRVVRWGPDGSGFEFVFSKSGE